MPPHLTPQLGEASTIRASGGWGPLWVLAAWKCPGRRVLLSSTMQIAELGSRKPVDNAAKF